ncbi:serine hydrolase domain-containing protein [Pseudoalteromonas pernae]|uniref:serine hydrolase domain-containing protein n=1 Tax=Pseudoalteromonas pernae TaxID=3118054 RepID=UPI0032427138
MRNLVQLLLLISALIFAQSGVAKEELQQSLDDYFGTLYKADMPGAVVLVAKEGEILLHQAYGLANVEHQIPLTTDMHFRIASLTKQFTTTAALKLHQNGEIDVNDPITKYLPGYPTHGQNITIEHLATNRSGIPDYVFFEGFLGKDDIQPKTLDQLIAYFSSEPLEFEPNEKQQYSSSNFIVLGKLIEVVSAQSYENYLKETFFEPLGMNSTAYGRHETIMPGRVNGYALKDEELINAPYISMTVPHAAGALRSTTMDLYRWQRGLIDGAVLPEELLELAWSRKTMNDGYTSNYAYGWNVGEIGSLKSLSHSGGIPGFSTFAAFLPEQDVHVIILSNFPEAVDDSLINIAGKAILMALDKPTSPAKQAVHKGLLTTLPGEYQFGESFSATIIKSGDTLQMKFPWEEKASPLYFADKNSVYFDDSWSTFRLLPQDNPRGDIVLQYWNGARIYGHRL